MKWKNLGLAVTSIVVCALALELGLRIHDALAPDQVLQQAGSERNRPPDSQKLGLGDLVEASPDPDQIYQLRAGLTGRFKKAELSINRDGHRGPAVSRPRADAVDLRLVVLGDSVAFGWGVADVDTYSRQLESDLRAAHPDRRIEVVNLGVPGYNVHQEVAWLERNLPQLAPDAILLLLNGNDAGLPNFLRSRPSPWSLSGSRLLEMIGRRVAWLRGDRAERLGFGEPDSLVRTREMVLDGRRLEAGEETVADTVPAAYRGMVGLDAAERALRRLGDRARALDAPVFIALYYPQTGLTRVLEPLIRELGWRRVRLDAPVRAHLAASGEEFDQMVLSARDPHPNAAYHRLIAEAFAEQGVSDWAAARWAGSRPGESR